MVRWKTRKITGLVLALDSSTNPCVTRLLEISVYVLGSNRLLSVSTYLELSPEFRSEVELLLFFGKHSRRLLDNREGESP